MYSVYSNIEYCIRLYTIFGARVSNRTRHARVRVAHRDTTKQRSSGAAEQPGTRWSKRRSRQCNVGDGSPCGAFRVAVNDGCCGLDGGCVHCRPTARLPPNRAAYACHLPQREPQRTDLVCPLIIHTIQRALVSPELCCAAGLWWVNSCAASFAAAWMAGESRSQHGGASYRDSWPLRVRANGAHAS